MDFLATSDAQLLVGVSVAVGLVAIAAAYFFFSSNNPKVCLDSENFKEFKLVKKTQLSHNVAKFRFDLPTPTSVLGLPIGQHISCRCIPKGECPIILDFREMREGDYLAAKGPKGRFRYEPGEVKAFGMIAGGSGITPMFQVARAILENPSDKTKVHLIYANVTYDDILLKDEIDGLAKSYPDQFQVYYVLNQPPQVWNGGVGFVSKEMIEAQFPAPAANIRVLRCGPPPMNKAMAAHLDALGYTPEMHFQF